jgi:hypothetical protein
VRNLLDNGSEPDQTVETRERTSYGDITSHRLIHFWPWRKGNHDYQAIRLDRHGVGR